MKHSLWSVKMNSLCKAEPQFRSSDSWNHSPDTNRWLCFVSTPNEIVFLWTFYTWGRQGKQCEVYWTPVYHCHHFMAGLDNLILVCGFYHANLQMDAWPQELSKYAVNNGKLVYIQGVPGGMWNTSGECSLC